MQYKELYRRNLPHWQPRGAIIFLTYRLAGTIPQSILQAIRDEYERQLKSAVANDRASREKRIVAGKRFIIEIDKVLDAAQYGPRWLVDPDIAAMIVENVHHHAEKLFRLWAYVVMPNHVHVLFYPMSIKEQKASTKGSEKETNFVPLARITHALKSYTGTQANKILKRAGKFWQDESYDHWVRNEDEFWRIVEYVERNPVKAKLCDEPTEWQWSSAFERDQLGIGYLDPLPGANA